MEIGSVGLERRVMPGAVRGRQDDFARILGKAWTGVGDEAQARRAAEEFVAITLVQPMLGELRASNHAAAPFAPTSGERQFQQMLDAHLAQNIVRAKQFPLVDRVARQLLRDSAGAGPTPSSGEQDATGTATRGTDDAGPHGRGRDADGRAGGAGGGA